jgi:hypothetical protein
MAVIEIAKIQVRRGQENLTGMPQLDSGEFGWAEDTEHLYIGKRIVDGAADDKNARILTENDLVNIFAAINSTSTSAVYYKYRQDVEYINTMTVAQTVQKKLDDLSPSLTDFGVIQDYTGTDITLEFKNAVQTLFLNSEDSLSYQRNESRRTLRVPAGSYKISEPIDLPPYSRIVGEGPGLTVLTVEGDVNLFRTVDADGNRFDSMDTMTDVVLPQEIHIEGMTLQCSTASAYTTSSIVSLDNVNGARVVNCRIGSQDWETTSSVYPYGIGIHIRGNLGNGEVGDTVQCKNVYVNDCTIAGLGVGIQSTGTVIRPIIENNLFGTLVQGIKFEKGAAGNSPTNGTIINNRFQNIEEEAIYVGTDTIRTNHLSSNNFFINVGNGSEQYTDKTTTSTGLTPVITFYAGGNKTVNDYFYRRDYANTTTSTVFYYAPLVVGSTTIDDDGTYSYTVGQGEFAVSRFSVNKADQLIKINYQISGSADLTTATQTSRKGDMVINLTPNGGTHINETYDYVEDLEVWTTGTTAMTATLATAYSTGTITGSNINQAWFRTDRYGNYNGSTRFGLPRLSDIKEGVWFITGNNFYQGYAAQILTRGFNSTSTSAIFTCDSFMPIFDFSNPEERWTILRGNNPAVKFYTLYSPANNYVTLYATNATTTTFTLEYQASIVQ